MTTATVIGALILYPVLCRLAVIDRATFRLPDRLTLPLLAAGLLWSGAVAGGWPWAALAGAGAGYASFAAIGWGFFRWRGVDGLGLGDAKLLAAGGAWTGIGALPWIVLLAALCALGAAWAGGAGRGTRLAFGPWLALGIGLVWAVGRLG